MEMNALDELSTILRPPGQGIYLVSTGKAEQVALAKRLLGARSEAEIHRAFVANLKKVENARGIILGIPSDVGAGYRRGANLGPQAIRTRLLDDDANWPTFCESQSIVDIGDAFVVPQLLHDSMLSNDLLDASRAAVYPHIESNVRATLPVSPLSIAERAVDLILSQNPAAKIFALGGDHSTSWPIVSAVDRSRKKTHGAPWGIVQIDAHTDLLSERLGIRYCFATWSFHANELLGRNGRLTQAGIRASARDRHHWESTLGVRQFWADEILRDPTAVMEALVAHVKATGIRQLYFSNDIDGTDSRWADATGTPEPNGLTPDWILALVERLGREFELLGGDVMEVAPPLSAVSERTVGIAAKYFRATIEAALQSQNA